MRDEATTCYRFGPFRLDAEAEELWRWDVRLHLTPQAIQLLLLFVERPGKLLSRNAIRRALWPEHYFIEYETAINSLVHQLRRALGDHAASARYIETLPRRGYRFLATVTRDVAAEPLPPPSGTLGATPQQHRSARLGTTTALAAFVLVCAIAAALLPPRAQPHDPGSCPPWWHPTPAVRIERFETDGQPASAAFAATLNDQLLRELAILRPAGVVARVPGAVPASSDITLRASIAMQPATRAVTVRCLQGSRLLWQRRFGSMTAAAAETIAQAMVRALAATLLPRTSGEPRLTALADVPTLRLYRAARQRSRDGSAASLRAAVPLYEAAIARQPRFAEAHSGLSATLTGLELQLPPDTAALHRRALAELAAALRLRPGLAEARLAAGVLALVCDRNPVVAAQSIRTAIQLDPAYADAHLWYAAALSALGRNEAAIASLRLAQDLHPAYDETQLAPLVYYNARRFEDALVAYRHCLVSQPKAPETLWGLTTLLTAMHREREAATCFHRVLAVDPGIPAADREAVVHDDVARGAQRVLGRMVRAGSAVD
ncbi:MAG TPA: winged helix-turn-helix domain-containing protein, partial [Thermoanaerobaculia bacterium]|nr:winged helix-turn-helix domain-containing protein [Thermoanaerobaculia bacterium]